MKHCIFLFILLLITANVLGQEVKIKPGLKVKYTDMRCIFKEANNQKMNLNFFDFMEGDTLVFSISTPPYVVNIVELSFIKNEVIPKFYSISDDGPTLTMGKFKSLDLTLNRNNLKYGDTLVGKIKAVGFIDQGSGKTYEFKGEFRHIIENTPEKRKIEQKERMIRAQNRPVTPTGFYTILDDHDGENFKLQKYPCSGSIYYLYDELHFSLYAFSGFSRIFDPKKLSLTLKFSIKKDYITSFIHQKEYGLPLGFVLDNKLMQVDPVSIDENNKLIIELKVKDKKEADRLTSILDRDMRSAKKDK